MQRYGVRSDGVGDFGRPTPTRTRLSLSCDEPEIGVERVWGWREGLETGRCAPSLK